MKILTCLRPFLLFCLAAPVLAGCGSHSDGYTADQQARMKSGKPPQITPDQRARMEAALRGHMGPPTPAAASGGAVRK